MKEKKRLIVVLGMHRSGTSAIARGLTTMGVELGDNHLPAKPDNEKGFWEDADINALNIELLTFLNRDWHSLEEISADNYKDPNVNLYKLRAKELLSKKIKNVVFFGLKDPRISILLPFWNDIFKSLKLDVSYILAIRNPLSVASSLAKRNRFDVQKSFYLWLKYTISSILQTEGFSRVVVDYDLFMDDTEGQLNRISDRLHLSFKGFLNDKSHFINHFIDGDLRHTKFSIQELEANSAALEEVVETYQLMSKLARDEVSIESKVILDAFVKLAERLGNLQAAFSFMDIQDKRVSNLNNEISNLNNEISNLNNEISNLNNEISNLSKIKQTVVNLKKMLAERDIEINITSNLIYSLYNSSSWRLTRPLRAIGNLIKHVNYLSVFDRHEGKRVVNESVPTHKESSLPIFGSDHLTTSRFDMICGSLDITAVGVEVGPSYSPILPKKQGYLTVTVDHMSAEDLRAKYKAWNVDISAIEEVDIIWKGEAFSEVFDKKDSFNYIVASHVIEHIPDPIRFFWECEKILKPNGKISLVIPDKRFCFDFYRPLTTTGEWVEAYLEKHTVHPPRKHFDNFAYAATKGDAIAWSRGADGDITLQGHTLIDALNHAEKQHSSLEYLDVHGWQFTPESFSLIMKELQSLGLINWSIIRSYPTHGFEFYVTLQRSSEQTLLTYSKTDRQTLVHSSLKPCVEDFND